MQATRPHTRCPVYLHPAACDKHLIEMIQRQTGQFLVLANTRPKASLHINAHPAPSGPDAA